MSVHTTQFCYLQIICHASSNILTKTWQLVPLYRTCHSDKCNDYMPTLSLLHTYFLFN